MKYTDKFNYNLIDKIASPVKGDNINETINIINIETKRGKILYLYQYYQKHYGDQGLSTNIVVPFMDIYESRNLKNKIVCELVVINDPEDAERIVNEHIKKVSNLKPYVYDSIISTTDVEHWKSQRKSYQQAFNVNDSLKPLIPISNNRAKTCVKTLLDLSKNCSQEVNINDFFLDETHAQLQLAMFGFSEKFEKKTNKKIRKTFSGQNNEYGKQMITDLFNEVEESSGPLSEAIKQRDKENTTKLEKPGNALIFSFAGHDTTGNTLTWLIYEISKNKIIQYKLQNEIDDFWKTQQDKEIDYNDFKRLPYTTRCIMETLRLWNPLPNGTFRELTKDETIKGLNNKQVLLKKGTYIQIPNMMRHLNPKLWGDDVNIFNPDREFKDEELWFNSVINSYNPSTERFSPFTYGPRDCIGKNFSQIEMRLILLHLLKNYNFSLTEKQANTYVQEDMSYNSFTMGPRNIYNELMEDSNQGMYVNITIRDKGGSKL